MAKRSPTRAQRAPDCVTRHFYRIQARQENFHARLFEIAIRLIRPKGARLQKNIEPMTEYGKLLNDALARQDHADVLLGQQVILEAFGESILKQLDYGMRRRDIGFARIRRVVLAQERAHHAFGQQRFASLAAANPARYPWLRERAAQYLGLTDEMIARTASLFETFGQDPAEYRAAVRREVPAWLGLPA